MQANNYIFLDRNWESDQTHINRILKYQTDLNAKPNILYFPEGLIVSYLQVYKLFSLYKAS